MKIFLKSVFSIYLLSILTGVHFAYAQEKVTVSGKVKNASNGEELIGATLLIKELSLGNVTNTYGFYSISVPKGKYTLILSYIGFKTQEISLDLQASQTLDVQLEEESTEIEEIVVLGEDVDKNVTSMDMGVTQLEMRSIKQIPALLGEVDVIRSIQMTPGVSTVGEGAAGFNVRGGSIGQNLILLDESPVYNSSHLFGFFSVFNPDAVKDVKLVKGGIPAQYGGRLASLLDVRMKEGNSKKFTTSAGIGTVSSRLAIEAPIVKDKSSFILAGRRSYMDLFARLSSDPEINSNILYFYDLSAKMNYKINTNNQVYLSGYFGKDVFRFRDEFKSDWGNSTGTIRWNHLFHQKLFANFTGTYSKYDYSLGVPRGTDSFEWTSDITTYNGKADFTYYLNPKNTITFGGGVIAYEISPGNVQPGDDNSIFNAFNLEKSRAREYAVFVDNEQKITSRLSAQYGIRYSLYNLLGRDDKTFYEYVEGEEGQRKEAANPQMYADHEIVTTYQNFEPRASLRYQLNSNSSLKLSYNRMAQYIHLISNTTAASPTDVWTLSTNNIKPQLADQIAVGYFKNFKDNAFETSIEAYYKTMENQIDYVDGANLLLNEELEAELLYGKGRSYGVELYVKKNSGRLNGWVSYTLSKSERKIRGLNRNEWYNAKYDRTHNLSVVTMYKLSPRLSIAGNFAYATGVSTTFPNARFEYEGMTLPYNSDGSRNNYRVPAYHRLDLSLTLDSKKKPGRKWEGSWVFSVYNVYARKNAFTVYFRQDEKSPENTEAVRLAIFGSVLPSVTYNIKF